MTRKPKPTRPKRPAKTDSRSRWIRVTQRRGGSYVAYYVGVYGRNGRPIEAHCMSVRSLKATITRWCGTYGMPSKFRAFVGGVGLLDWFFARHGRPSEVATGNVRIRTETRTRRPAKAERPKAKRPKIRTTKAHLARAGDPFREGDLLHVELIDGRWRGYFERKDPYKQHGIDSGCLTTVPYAAADAARSSPSASSAVKA
jgi:hypothetical protein